MKTFTLDELQAIEKRDDLAVYFGEGWSGTALDMLTIDGVNSAIRLRFALRILDKQSLCLFGILITKKMLRFVGADIADPCREACDISYRFIDGLTPRSMFSDVFLGDMVVALGRAEVACVVAAKNYKEYYGHVHPKKLLGELAAAQATVRICYPSYFFDPSTDSFGLVRGLCWDAEFLSGISINAQVNFLIEFLQKRVSSEAISSEAISRERVK